jgi:hypothetical protein
MRPRRRRWRSAARRRRPDDGCSRVARRAHFVAPFAMATALVVALLPMAAQAQTVFKPAEYEILVARGATANQFTVPGAYVLGGASVEVIGFAQASTAARRDHSAARQLRLARERSERSPPTHRRVSKSPSPPTPSPNSSMPMPFIRRPPTSSRRAPSAWRWRHRRGVPRRRRRIVRRLRRGVRRSIHLRRPGVPRQPSRLRRGGQRCIGNAPPASAVAEPQTGAMMMLGIDLPVASRRLATKR